MLHDIIKKVPRRDYGMEGLEVHVDHTTTGTVYFVSAEKEVVFPEHSHAAQWTIVVSGSCTFTADGESKIYSAGETYFIPAGLKHQITLHAGYSEVDYVDDPLDGEEINMGNKVIAGLQTIVTELSQQADGHLIQSRIFASQGLNKLADKYKEHAAVEYLKHDLQISKDGLAWLKEIVCAAQDDLTTFKILSEYYQDEEGDMYWAEQQLALIELIGKQNWLVKQL